jgi:hypothetical protein
VRETTYISRFLHNDRRDGEAQLTPCPSRTVTHKPHRDIGSMMAVTLMTVVTMRCRDFLVAVRQW